MPDVGKTCVDCRHSQSIPNMRADDAGKVFCLLGQCRVHTNGLCSDYADPTSGDIFALHRKINAASHNVVVAPLTWREKIKLAQTQQPEPQPAITEVAPDIQEDLF